MISIVTINLNNKNGLRKTIESVVNQTYFDKIEYIIIDGGSTDGSVDVIKEYADKISYWVSEPDSGIFNAMNKGVDASNGEYSLYLNSGDYFNSYDIIEKVYDELDKDIVYGNENKLKQGRIAAHTVNLAKYPDVLGERFFKMSALPHQSTFIKTSLLKQYKYSENYKLLGDWLFFREMIMVKKVSYKHIPIVISNYGLDGVSTTQRNLHNAEKDEYYKNI